MNDDSQCDMNSDQRLVAFLQREAQAEQRMHDDALDAALANRWDGREDQEK